MKRYNHIRIRRAEIAQLILLQCLFARNQSRDIIFQGGTALRWFYGGMRFSEDLDFVTSLGAKDLSLFLDATAPSIQRQMAANFGAGHFSIKPKSARENSSRSFVVYAPAGVREKISVKLEFEKLSPENKPTTARVVMQSSPAVAWFLGEGGYKSAGAATVVNLETAEEILTDKLRALMERPYTKGRDFFDVWFLTRTLGIRVDPDGLRKKLGMYATPFRETTPADFYATLDKLSGRKRHNLVQEIRQDLERFLDAETLAVLAQNQYETLVNAVQEAFRQVVPTPRPHPKAARPREIQE
jgi:predicted nucleotidyltransferase component of viral defense system